MEIIPANATNNQPSVKRRRPSRRGARQPAEARTPDARRLALDILNRLDKSGRPLDQELAQTIENHPALAARERRLLNALILGVLRWRGRIDYIIAHFADTPLSKIDPPVLNILRLALFQMMYLSRIPQSAAVNTAVALAKTHARPWTVRFVNAVLRRAAVEHDTVVFPDLAQNRVAALAAVHAFPKWLVVRWLERFGHAETSALLKALNQIPPISLRTNTLKTTRAQLMTALKDQAKQLAPAVYAAEGIFLSGPAVPVDGLKPFAKGWFQVQDEAAQLVTELLDPQPGETVLDACAGLGGKTGHMAQQMQNKGRIIALDHRPAKLKQLQKEMARLTVTIVETVAVDLNRPLPADLGLFDRVLMDAPCSGLGVIGRNPDTKWAADKRDLRRYQKRQIAFLKTVAPLVKPAGSLVYAVCSFEPEETTAVIDAFLETRPQFKTVPPVFSNPQTAPLFRGDHDTVTVLPHKTGDSIHMDGFFMVRLVKSVRKEC